MRSDEGEQGLYAMTIFVCLSLSLFFCLFVCLFVCLLIDFFGQFGTGSFRLSCNNSCKIISILLASGCSGLMIESQTHNCGGSW